jgi:hypothetical protein
MNIKQFVLKKGLADVNLDNIAIFLMYSFAC